MTDLFRFTDLPDLQIVLHDIDAERLMVAHLTAVHLTRRFEHSAEVIVAADRRQALQGADFVINMIQVGGIDATRADLELPALAGLRQTIGDTIGIGGIFRGLRTFPVLSAIAADMAELCPQAWFLNYTNPMAMNIWWLAPAAPALKVVGLCHSVYWTVHDLCKLIAVPLSGTYYRAGGVNHQAWLTEWSHDGEDLYPRLHAAIDADPELRRRVRVEIFSRVGYYPTETSEHSSEYVSWFLRSNEQIEHFRLRPLEYLGISERNLDEFQHAKAMLAAGVDLPLEDGAAEYAPQVIHSLLTGTERTIHANVINHGLIDNLPQESAVEVPTRIDAHGVHPIPFGCVPTIGAALNHAYLSVAKLTIEAARTGNPLLVRQAALADPNASSSLTPQRIWDLCDDLTAAHAAYLPTSLGGHL